MVKITGLKICIRDTATISTKKIERICDALVKAGCRVMLQIIDNQLHGIWLKGQKVMIWKNVIDVTSVKSGVELMAVIEKQIGQKLKDAEMDIYEVEEITYQKPILQAEIITSCYLWNYEASSKERKAFMLEHFELEKQQSHYDYVSFQKVIRKHFESSPKYDFFFEAHVSDKEGIDMIYSEPTLQGMRTHSQKFLNIETRRLAFGKVTTWGRINEF